MQNALILYHDVVSRSPTNVDYRHRLGDTVFVQGDDIIFLLDHVVIPGSQGLRDHTVKRNANR